MEPSEQAQATITELLQAGKDEGACADLAAATIKEVEDSVDNQQKILNALDTGADCPKEGQDTVDSANAGLQQAQKNKEDADAAWVAAKTAMVKLGPKTLSSLSPGDCGFVFNDPAYTSAKSTAETAENTAVAAGGAVTSAQQAVVDAQEAQAKLVAACQCKVKRAHDKAWESANKNNDADTQAYTKGKHMECVLAGTAPADCQVGEVPKVTAITLADDIANMNCVTPAPTAVPTPQPTPNPTAPANSPGCSHTVGNYCESEYKVTTCPTHYSRILSQSDCTNGFANVRGMSKNPTVSCWGGHPKGCFTHGTSSPSSLLFNTCGKTSGSTYSDTKTLCRYNRL